MNWAITNTTSEDMDWKLCTNCGRRGHWDRECIIATLGEIE